MRSSSSESDRTYDNSWSENSSDNRRFSSSAARRRSCSERIRRWRRRHSNAATPTTRRATAALRTGCSRHMFMLFYILLSFLRINLEPAIARSCALSLLIAACGREPRPPISRAWPLMGTTLSAAAWGADSTRVARALDAARDSVDRIDSLLRKRIRIAALDSVREDVRRQSGVALPPDSVAIGYALDRAALALGPVVDSTLLSLGEQFRWIGPATRPTHRSVGVPDPDNTLRSLGAVEMWGGSVRTKSQRNAHGATVRSVTVLAATAAAADAWAAAFMVVGCDSALALAPRLAVPVARVSVVCVDSAGTRSTTDLGQRFLRPTGRVP